MANTTDTYLTQLIVNLKDEVTANSTVMEGSFGRLSNSIGSFRSALMGLGVGVGIGGFTAMIHGLVDAGAELHRLSISTGFTVETLSGLKPIVEGNGSSIDSFATSVLRAFRNLESGDEHANRAAAAMAKLGFSVEDVNTGLSDPTGLLKAFIDRIGKIENPALRAQIAMDVMGRGAIEQIPALKALAEEGFDKVTESATRMTTATAAALDAYKKGAVGFKEDIKNIGATALAELLLLSRVATLNPLDKMQHDLQGLQQDLKHLDDYRKTLFGPFLQSEASYMKEREGIEKNIESLKKLIDAKKEAQSPSGQQTPAEDPKFAAAATAAIREFEAALVKADGALEMEKIKLLEGEAAVTRYALGMQMAAAMKKLWDEGIKAGVSEEKLIDEGIKLRDVFERMGPSIDKSKTALTAFNQEIKNIATGAKALEDFRSAFGVSLPIDDKQTAHDLAAKFANAFKRLKDDPTMQQALGQSFASLIQQLTDIGTPDISGLLGSLGVDINQAMQKTRGLFYQQDATEKQYRGTAGYGGNLVDVTVTRQVDAWSALNKIIGDNRGLAYDWRGTWQSESQKEIENQDAVGASIERTNESIKKSIESVAKLSTALGALPSKDITINVTTEGDVTKFANTMAEIAKAPPLQILTIQVRTEGNVTTFSNLEATTGIPFRDSVMP